MEIFCSGRRIITTNRAGCRKVVEDGVNGYMILCRDRSALTDAVERFLKLSWSEKMIMGKRGEKSLVGRNDFKSYKNEVKEVRK